MFGKGRGEVVEKGADGPQLAPAVAREQAVFDGAQRAEELPAELVGEIGRLDQNAAAIVGVIHATRQAGSFEAIQRDAHAPGGQRRGVGELRGSQRPAACEQVNAVEVGPMEAEILRRAPVHRVDLACQSTQRRSGRSDVRSFPDVRFFVVCTIAA